MHTLNDYLETLELCREELQATKEPVHDERLQEIGHILRLLGHVTVEEITHLILYDALQAT